MELTTDLFDDLMKDFPVFKSSYETASVPIVKQYGFGLAIPMGKKQYVWFTCHPEEDAVYLLDINRDKKIYRAVKQTTLEPTSIAHGTLLYGTNVIDEETGGVHFVVEDIYQFRGYPIKKMGFVHKLEYMVDAINDANKQTGIRIQFALPMIWTIDVEKQTDLVGTLNDEIVSNAGYDIHHLQFRAGRIVAPYLNINHRRKMNHSVNKAKRLDAVSMLPIIPIYKPDYAKPQYGLNAIFDMTADMQCDIYHLHACGKNNSRMYYNVAYVPSYKASVWLNQLYRNIKENRNLDAIEESDDEEEFENTHIDRFVDLKKTLQVECSFSRKFKRWVPQRIVSKESKIVHIRRLVRGYHD